MAELAVENLEVWYGGVQAVRGVNLTLHDGECVAVLGPNGAGKTSLFRAISRLVPYRGSVKLDGRLISGEPEQVVRAGIAQILEGRHIFGELTVRDNLLLARFASSPRDFQARMDAVLDFFPLLKPRLGALGGQLSGGQQQILALARGLLTSPRVLLIDEPSLGLAPVIVQQLCVSIPAIRKDWNTSVLLAEQAVHVALAVADRICILSRGSIVYDGAPDAAVLHSEVISGYFGEEP